MEHPKSIEKTAIIIQGRENDIFVCCFRKVAQNYWTIVVPKVTVTEFWQRHSHAYKSGIMAEQQKVFSPDNSIKITKWKVKDGYRVSAGQLILLYIDADGDPTVVKRLKSPRVGVVQRRLFKEGDVVPKG